MNYNIREKTIIGVKWSITSQWVNQSFVFAITIVLARILGPKVYGLIGMITVFTGFATVFGDFGLGDAIIQRKELEPRHLNAVFWTNIFIGSFLTLLMVTLAPVVAWFYKEPMLLALTAVIALKFIFDSMFAVQVALLYRKMQFRALAGIQIGSTVISGLVGLGMALNGMGPWSLVAQTLGASVVSFAVSWKLGNWRPRFSLNLRDCKELFGFSTYILGYNIVNYWARTLDNLLIGRLIGPTALGIYSRAYSMMLMPLNQVSRVVGKVMFPALSVIQDDKLRTKRAYLKSVSVIGLITFPMMIGAFAISEHFIPALLGEKWAGVIPIFKIFCWIGLLQSINSTMGWIYLSQGRARLYFTMGLIFTIALVVAFIVGIRWGIIGVSWSYFIFNLIIFYPSCIIPSRLINITFYEILNKLGPAFICALVMGVVVWMVGLILPVDMSHWMFIAIQIPLGVVVYLIMVKQLRLDSWKEGWMVFSEMVGKRFGNNRPEVLN